MEKLQLQMGRAVAYGATSQDVCPACGAQYVDEDNPSFHLSLKASGPPVRRFINIHRNAVGGMHHNAERLWCMQDGGGAGFVEEAPADRSTYRIPGRTWCRLEGGTLMVESEKTEGWWACATSNEQTQHEILFRVRADSTPALLKARG